MMVSMSTPERRMLERIVDGDPAAKAWLFDTFASRLLRRLRRRYGDLDAEELLQDAYLLALRDDAALLLRVLERLPPAETTEARVEGWLWDQACGLASNRRRSVEHRRVVPLLPRSRRTTEPGPERRSVARDTLKQLDRCLGSSDRRTYLYFQMRYVDGLKPAEIARATGWSRKVTYKLKQTLDAALRRCAEALGIEVR